MKFLVILCLAISTNAMPQMGNTNQTGSDQTWSDWAKEQQDQVANTYGEGKDQIMQGWEWLQEFLPRRVGSYLEETADGGQKVFEDLWEESISGNVDDITGLVETFIDKLENVRVNAVDIVFQEEPLSNQQIQAKNVQEDLEGIKKELTGLNEEIAKDQKEDKKFENFGWDDPKIDNCQVLEGMIQRLITVRCWKG
eukprot:GFUD01051270.1.p1 GENE.GFUD01051270.1~~GFUD01051270.1.p1  ORF type:complete len:196 (+),score=86.44 GFUD01051270.1:88-675(+)